MPSRPITFRLRHGGVALLAGLAGCATPPPPSPPVPRYVAPVSGPTARLVVRSTVGAEERYGIYVLDQAENCSGHRIVGAGDATRHPATTTLAADRQQTVEFRVVRPDRKLCRVRWTFTPVAGRSYLLAGKGLPNACSAALLDMTDADRIHPDPTALRRTAPGVSCAPLAQSKPVVASTDAGLGEDAVLRQGAGSDDLQGLIGH